MTFPSADPRSNNLLAALTDAELARWRPRLEEIDMPLGLVLHESRAMMSFVIFPTTAIVSLLYVTEDGSSSEIAIVGNEGVVGTSLFMGGESMPSRAVVQNPGKGFRLSAAFFKEAFENIAVRQLLLRYTQALTSQISQMAVCNRHHVLDRQLCRLLLFRSDRLQGSDFSMTQDSIARLLGVRRGGVTTVTIKLREAGLIECSRGQIRLLDRPGLERRSCECYAVVKHEYDRLLPPRVGRCGTVT